MKVNSFQGALTDNSATTKPLETSWSVPVSGSAVVRPLCFKKGLEHANELEIGSGRHVVLPSKFSKVLIARTLNLFVHQLAQVDDDWALTDLHRHRDSFAIYSFELVFNT